MESLKFIKEIINKNPEKKFVSEDIRRIFGLEYNYFPDSSTIYAVINKLEKEGFIIKEDRGNKQKGWLIYKNQEKSKNHETEKQLISIDDTEINGEMKKILEQIVKNQKIIAREIIILKGRINNIPSNLTQILADPLGTAICNRVNHELDEYWKGFSQNLTKIHEEYIHLHKQNGMIISICKQIKSTNRLKSGKDF